MPDLNQCEELVDYGNVEHDHDALIDTQKEYAELAAKSIQNHKQTFLLGGGHDIAYAQYLATRKVYLTNLLASSILMPTLIHVMKVRSQAQALDKY